MRIPIDTANANPWISSSGVVAHPASPCGGGGLGNFSIPGPMGCTSIPWGLPHPQSHSGRRILASDLSETLLAQNDKRPVRKLQASDAGAAPSYPVAFKEFNNNSVIKYVDAIKGNTMGVHPKGNFPWLNAVEIIFAIDSALAGKMRITEYRARQRIYSAELWQKELKDGKVTPWKLLVTVGEGPDDPDKGLVTTTKSIIAYHDAPGFMGGSKDTQFLGPSEIQTSKFAVYVFMRQNFIGWIEGATGAGKHQTWQQVSDEVKWHSNQSLVRNIFGSDRTWLAGDGCEIKLGHTQGQPP